MPEPSLHAHAPQWHRHLRNAVQWCGTLVLGAYILSRTDLSAILQVLGRAEPLWIGVAVALLALDRAVAAIKWRALLHATGIHLPFGSVLAALLKGTFLGSALPATVGIDLIRARLVTPPGGDYHRALGSVLVERAIGVASLLFAALVGVVAFTGSALPRAVVPLLVLATAALAIAGLVIMVPTARLRLDEGGGSRSIRALRWLRKLQHHLRVTYRDRGLLAIVFGIALAQHYLVSVVTWVLALSLDVQVPLVAMLWIWPVIMLAIRLPISVLGFGVREALLLQFLAPLGFSSTAAVSLGLLSGGLDLAMIASGGLLVLFGDGRARRRVRNSRGKEVSR